MARNAFESRSRFQMDPDPIRQTDFDVANKANCFEASNTNCPAIKSNKECLLRTINGASDPAQRLRESTSR